MRFDLASITDRGGRRSNEDRLALIRHTRLLAGVVADGAGGHGGGDVAAQLTVDTVCAVLGQCAMHTAISTAQLADALFAANRAIVQAQAAGGVLAHMRSTAAVLAIDPLTASAAWAHCGDTRIYCFRQGRTALQTVDHSMVQNLVDARLLASHEMRGHPMRSLLLAALGTTDALEVEAATSPFAIADGDTFLVCSDGLWEHIDEAEMIESIGEANDANGWLAALATRVRRVAPPQADNLSAVAVWAGAPREVTILALKPDDPAAAQTRGVRITS
ncbi:PP2C family serine/threonine-protein phosphatase [Burkholderia sp. S171]|uniref:PP2C family protein-serine/threonine phosphatase n=1 Tax=Burkholderia sp. S171 TaxID=1641860 RepID=UPI00131AB058|nr:protein phosphatase 2C domain-containing protein [Burkholderia sp. S171]